MASATPDRTGQLHGGFGPKVVTPRMNCLILRHQTRDGASNMAFDEAMLDAVDADPSTAWLRTYEWSRPTLSLGYFQRFSDVQSDPRWNGADLVRRPTGGGAIWHHHDITYAIVLPYSHPAYADPNELYARVHEAIAAGLRSAGFDATRRGPIARELSKNRPFLCFTDRNSEDIVIQDTKIVGSSQRRRPRAVLQHGSVLLARSATTPELPGLSDLVDDPPRPAAIVEILRNAVPPALELFAVESAERAPWSERLQELGLRYQSRHWTARR
jgi:lipoate-protein ligase A